MRRCGVRGCGGAGYGGAGVRGRGAGSGSGSGWGSASGRNATVPSPAHPDISPARLEDEPGLWLPAPFDRLHPANGRNIAVRPGGRHGVPPARRNSRPSTAARAGKPSTKEARLSPSGSARRHAVEMTARRRLPMALRDASFRVRDALHRGVSRGRLDARDLVRPFHGIRSAFPPEAVDERARALAPRLRPDQVFSHVTAAAIIGIPLPRRLERDQRLHVTTIGTDQALRVRGTVGHRARYGSVRATIARGVPLTTPADTFVALGSMLTLDELIVAGDALVGWLGWATLDELAQAVRRRRGMRGIVKLRLALDEDPGGDLGLPERPGHGWHSFAAGSQSRRSTTMSSSTGSGSHVWTLPTPLPGSRSSTRAICTAPIPRPSGRT